MKTRVFVLVQRDEAYKDRSPMLVSALVPRGTDADELMQRIIDAVANWIDKGTPHARQARQDHGDSFSLRYLSGCIVNLDQVATLYGDDAALIRELIDMGVEDMTINTLDYSDNWTLDTPLINLENDT